MHKQLYAWTPAAVLRERWFEVEHCFLLFKESFKFLQVHEIPLQILKLFRCRLKVAFTFENTILQAAGSCHAARKSWL